MTTKICTQCGIDKPLSEFGARKETPDGKQHRCKICVNAQKLAYQKSERGQAIRKATLQRYNHSDKARVTRLKHFGTDKRKVSVEKYISGPKFKATKAAFVARNRTKQTGAGGSFTGEQFRELCKRHGSACLCCGEKKPLTPDHVKPVAKGGSSGIGNIQPLCRNCNSKKGNREIDYRN